MKHFYEGELSKEAKVPFISYADKEGVKEAQADTLLSIARNQTADESGKDIDNFGSDEIAILWSKFKDLIAGAKEKKNMMLEAEDTKGYVTYAKEQGISETKAKEYWEKASKEVKDETGKTKEELGSKEFEHIFGIFKQIIANASKKESFTLTRDVIIESSLIKKGSSIRLLEDDDFRSKFNSLKIYLNKLYDNSEEDENWKEEHPSIAETQRHSFLVNESDYTIAYANVHNCLNRMYENDMITQKLYKALIKQIKENPFSSLSGEGYSGQIENLINVLEQVEKFVD